MSLIFFRDLFGVHVVVTSMMVGIIWLIQLVHYPMMSGLDQANFKFWHEFHSRHISYIVAPLMVFELGASLVTAGNKFNFTNGLILALTSSVWLSTFALSVPIHNQLGAIGFNGNLLAKLVKTNWPRTALYTLKIAFMISVLIR